MADAMVWRLDRRTWRMLRIIAFASLAVLVLNLVAWVTEEKEPPPDRLQSNKDSDSPLDRAFDGSSASLLRTQVVPTLQNPIARDQSAVWCGTLGLAWRQLQSDVTRTPIALRGAEKLAGWLNKEPAIELEPEHYYVAAGLYRDGILERIRRELPARFPNAPLPEFGVPKDPPVAMAYAYLEVALKYQFEFWENQEPLQFTDAQGKATPVRSFGIRAGDKTGGFRSQVGVLFRERGEFALDLSTESKPYQVVVAKVPVKPTLAETLAELDRRIAAARPGELGSEAVMLVPTMCWRVQHRFRELERKPLLMPGWERTWLDEVGQMIDFRMDRKGVVLASAARVRVLLNGDEHDPDPHKFIFDRPYLVVLKKRDGRPFFVMWVANSDLLYPY